ncbi:MAG TPA: hypothetical protein VN026_18640, partial [Bacteroidia bacterium]|nr:hypothetical protein [Bacteroidia bacterium]
MKKQTKLILITLIVTGSSQKLFQQSSINGLVAGHAAAAGPVSSFWCGWDNLTTVPFNIEHRGTQDINFLTGGTQRMTIKGTGSANPGFVGMGTPSFPPLFQLDVNDNANLNINYNTTGAGFGYRINGDKLLSNPGISNTFVGKNAGAAWVFPGPGLFQQCTFVGEDAGPVSTGEGCTFVGTQSGLNNTAGTFNT